MNDDDRYVIPPPPLATLPVRGSTKVFPVHRIYGVGRNYAAHAREMGNDPTREPPFFFQKNPDTLVASGARFPYPDASRDVHHEVELVIALGRGGRNITRESALDRVFGYAVGLDMTRRDVQDAAIRAGLPWEPAKAFDFAAPCSEVVPAVVIGHPQRGVIWLTVNGQPRQHGDLGELVWDVPEIIAQLSTLFTLAAGDLIYSGTPAGVGPVARGDVLRGGIEGVGEILISVT